MEKEDGQKSRKGPFQPRHSQSLYAKQKHPVNKVPFEKQPRRIQLVGSSHRVVYPPCSKRNVKCRDIESLRGCVDHVGGNQRTLPGLRRTRASRHAHILGSFDGRRFGLSWSIAAWSLWTLGEGGSESGRAVHRISIPCSLVNMVVTQVVLEPQVRARSDNIQQFSRNSKVGVAPPASMWKEASSWRFFFS